jgi:hypothetical protein
MRRVHGLARISRHMIAASQCAHPEAAIRQFGPHPILRLNNSNQRAVRVHHRHRRLRSWDRHLPAYYGVAARPAAIRVGDAPLAAPGLTPVWKSR